MDIFDAIRQDKPTVAYKFIPVPTSPVSDIYGGSTGVLSSPISYNLIDDSTFSLTSKTTLDATIVNNIQGYFSCPWHMVFDNALQQNVIEAITPDTAHNYGVMVTQATVSTVGRHSVNSGSTYSLSAYVLLPAGVQIGLGAIYYTQPNPAGTNLGTSFASPITGTGQWQYISATISSSGHTSPTQYTQLALRLTTIPASGTVIRVANPQIQDSSSVLPYQATKPDGTIMYYGPSQIRIVAGDTFPLLLGQAKLDIPFSFMKSSFEDKLFTLEVWFRPISSSSEISLLSHTGAYDGLTYDGTNINFKIKFAAQPTALVSYKVSDWKQNYHVAGVFDGRAMKLYVNGTLEGSYSLTDAQLADTFATGTARLYSGENTAGTQTVLLDAPAVYAQALPARKVANHYAAGTSVISSLDNVTKRGGLRFDLIDSERNIGLELDAEWDDGLLSNCYISDDILKPAFNSSNVSLPGTWTNGMPIHTTGLVSIAGVKAEWEGTGSFIVQASINGGTTWTTITNGQLILSTMNIDTTNKFLTYRVVFTGGITDDTSEVYYINLTLYSDYEDISPHSSSRTITLNGAAVTATENEEMIILHDRTGLLLYGGTARINADSSATPANVGSIEMWVKLSEYGGNLYSDPTNNLTSTIGGVWSGTVPNIYINGVLTSAAAMSLNLNKWYHMVLTFTPHNGSMTIGTAAQIGKIATFPTTMTGADILDMYSSYFKVPKLLIDDASYSLTLTEDSSAYNLYSVDWSNSN